MDATSIVPSNTKGLVLTGGGARGAYQAGVIKGVAKILSKYEKQNPFRVLSGSSAGAINCTFLACGVESFEEVATSLCDMWAEITFSDIYKTNFTSLSRLVASWIRGLSFAGLGNKSAPNYLLDTSPLKELLQSKINFDNLKSFEDQGGLLAINATHYKTGATITFFSDSDQKEVWNRNLRLSLRAKIRPEHVMASSAIPILFPPVKIGNTFFGDGALRMKAPFSPAIHLGADKIMAISVRKPRSIEELTTAVKDNMDEIQISDIAGTMLNSVFLDSLDTDLERLRRINETLSKYERKSDEATLRPIEVLDLNPSEDLGAMAAPSIEYFPKTIRYLLSGMGADDVESSDFLSYLSFHPSYTKPLVELGYEDALKDEERILNFFTS